MPFIGSITQSVLFEGLMSRTLELWHNIWMFLNPSYSRLGQQSNSHRCHHLLSVATSSAKSCQKVKEDPTVRLSEYKGPCGSSNINVRVSVRAEPFLSSGWDL